MRPALRLTLAVALVGSSVVACAQEAEKAPFAGGDVPVGKSFPIH